jgi:SAM-dependent methyltransferase
MAKESTAQRKGRRAGLEPLLHGAARIRKEVAGMDECEFYHVVDLPDGSLTGGQWDLRHNADAYLGNVDFAGKRVLEIGPASGFLSFHMERQGARVAVIEPPADSFWDLVPQASADLAETRKVFGEHIQRIRNSFWFLHRCYGSAIECYEVDAYRIPPQPAQFDIGLLASVLLHVSSPVRMLESLANVVGDTIIIVERFFPELVSQPVCRLVPSTANRTLETWWEFSPNFFAQYLAVLGFSQMRATRHRQFFATIKQEWDMFTLVASR